MKAGKTWLLMRPARYWRRVRALFGSSLTAYWQLNETSGTTAFDSSGDDFHGTYYGPALAQMSIADGKAPYFDGVNDYTRLYSSGLAAAFDANEGSLLAFFYRKTTKAGYNTVFRFSSSTYNTDLWMYTIDNTFAFRRIAGGATHSRSINNAVTLGCWHHAAAAWSVNSDEMQVYLNGSPAPLSSGLASSAETCNAMNLAVSGGSYYFEGYLAHIILLDRAASSEEINAVYRLGL